MQKTYNKNQVIGIAVSDIHLSHLPPIARSNERNWYKVMKRYLIQLQNLANEYKGAPIVFGGDLFHTWKSPPELINFALKYVPHMYGIPGQHDLPNHNYEELHKSAFWTMVESKVITLLEPDKVVGAGTLRLRGFPFGFSVKSNTLESHALCYDVAVVHNYIWKGQCRFPNAPIKNKYTKFLRKLKTYDMAVFGDNHKGFNVRRNGVSLINCGGFIKRNADEVSYAPRVGLMLDNGTIKEHFLNTTKDVFLEQSVLKELAKKEIDTSSFLEVLAHTDQEKISFIDNVTLAVNSGSIPKKVCQKIIEIMETLQHGP